MEQLENKWNFSFTRKNRCLQVLHFDPAFRRARALRRMKPFSKKDRLAAVLSCQSGH
jgi:hypothetical protein